MKFTALMVFFLTAQLLVAPVTSNILILCVGSDGHVAVESASTGVCCREWNAAQQAALGTFSSSLDPATGPCCNDVELSVGSAVLMAHGQKVLAAPVALYGLPIPSLHLNAVSTRAHPLTIESSVAASLRTVVLRT